MKSATQKISKISNDRLLVKEEVSEAMMEAFRRDKGRQDYPQWRINLLDHFDFRLG
jgi:hypothetical protein